jgi:hypothetical protein
MEKNIKDTTQYKFYWQILQGFELATNFKAEMLKTQVQLAIGDITTEKGLLKTGYAEGRYPVWNKFDFCDVKLQSELTFESDLRVTIQNEKKGIFGGLSNQIIGEF